MRSLRCQQPWWARLMGQRMLAVGRFSLHLQDLFSRPFWPHSPEHGGLWLLPYGLS